MDEIGRNVRRLRREREWSQEYLAKKAGANATTVNHVEKGKVSPTVDTLEKLARALDVNVADLFPKAPAPSEGRFTGAEVAALARAYLEARTNASRSLSEWRKFADSVARDWEREDREITLDEIRTVLASLERRIASGVLEIRHHKKDALVDEFADTRSLDAADESEIELLHKAVARMKDAADPVLQREQADRERARFELVAGGLASEPLRRTG